AAIHAASFPPREAWGADAIGLQLALPGAFGLVDERGGMLLGCIVADQAEVLTLAVVPQARRRGIGAGLLQKAMALATERGGATLFLEVATSNAAALALYRRRGFVGIARRQRYYADGSDALVMRVKLL